jgi:hypothetical protein
MRPYTPGLFATAIEKSKQVTMNVHWFHLQGTEEKRDEVTG